jgi:hypothetical protein
VTFCVIEATGVVAYHVTYYVITRDRILAPDSLESCLRLTHIKPLTLSPLRAPIQATPRFLTAP